MYHLLQHLFLMEPGILPAMTLNLVPDFLTRIYTF